LALIDFVSVTEPPASPGVYFVSVVPVPGAVTVRTRPSGSYVVFATDECAVPVPSSCAADVTRPLVGVAPWVRLS
jgi:hypothetical protein